MRYATAASAARRAAHAGCGSLHPERRTQPSTAAPSISAPSFPRFGPADPAADASAAPEFLFESLSLLPALPSDSALRSSCRSAPDPRPLPASSGFASAAEALLNPPKHFFVLEQVAPV